MLSGKGVGEAEEFEGRGTKETYKMVERGMWCRRW
jgi:hypothetical protein